METAMTFVRIAFAGMLFCCGTALAQSDAPPRNTAIVYKCVNPDGSVVYAQNPCSNDPKKVQTLDTSGALRTGSGGHTDEISASVADADCRENAYKSTHASADRVAESNKHIADYRQRRQTLEQISINGDAQAAKAMEDLDAAIATESEFQQKEMSFSEESYQNALKACDNARSAAAARSAPAAKPPTPPPSSSGG